MFFQSVDTRHTLWCHLSCAKTASARDWATGRCIVLPCCSTTSEDSQLSARSPFHPHAGSSAGGTALNSTRRHHTPHGCAAARQSVEETQPPPAMSSARALRRCHWKIALPPQGPD